MKSAADFFFAVNETTHIKGVSGPNPEEAVSFLELMADTIFSGLDKIGATGRLRDNIILWEGMLKGVQLRLDKDRLIDRQRAAAANSVFKADHSDS